jgi:Rieske Fe-S protein
MSWLPLVVRAAPSVVTGAPCHAPGPEVSPTYPGATSSPPRQLVRRDLLKVACASTGALCAALAGCGGEPPKATKVVTLPAAVNGRVELPLADFPELREVGGGLVGRANGIPEPIAITRADQAVFIALSGLCTHASTVLVFNRLNATFDCPLHGSTFELDGRVVTGPAERPLRLLPTELTGDVLGVLAQ